MVGNLIRKLIVLFGIDRLLPVIVNGKPLNAFICKFIPYPVHYRQPTYRVIYRNSIKFNVDLSDHMQWLIYFGHEVENRKALYGLLDKKYQILDVGANVGETALNMSKIAGPGSNVVAIEANSSTFNLLEENCRANPALIVNRINVGLSDEEGAMSIKRKTDRNKGADQLMAIDSSIGHDANQVRVKTIDNLIQENLLSSSIDLIKIDVEGMELQVLKGAKQLLLKSTPTLFFEFSENQFAGYNYSGQDIFSFLKQFNYQFVDASNMNEVRNSADIIGHTDIIATQAKG